MTSKHDITIIGAGIVGIATAIYLQRDGHRVTVVDRDEPGRGTSFGNAGSIAPSSIIPMALPGTLKNVPKWITDPLGPLTLSWRQAPALLPWLLHFRAACTKERARSGARALRSLNGPSLESYTELLASAGAPDLLRHDGMLHVYRTEAAFAGTAFARQLRTDYAGEVEVVDQARIHDLEPALSAQYRFGFFLRDNGHVRSPFRVVQVLAEHFKRNGGTIVRAAISGFKSGDDGPRALDTDEGEMPVDRVVICAGASARGLARQVGVRAPLAHERGYHIEIRDSGIDLRVPVSDGEARFVATPMENGIRLAGTSEFNRADAPANWQRSEALAKLGPRMLPGLNVERYEQWMGTRPSTPDSLPIVGRAPRCDRVYLAYGHGHFGLMAAPATGQVICDLVAGREPRIDIAPFRPDRFVLTY
ncbi:MAG: NAD(P)/FAD-dependent oxidoreductase [Burkholderiales bacterium]